MIKRVAVTIAEYLLGFFALATFAAVAFSAGAPSAERWVFAFKIGAALALIEIGILLHRSAPANRLILAANLWLFAGGVAALTQQWCWFKGYERLGESGLFLFMLAVGIVTTAFTPAGFVAARGPRRRVTLASVALLLAVLAALLASVCFRGNAKLAAVIPVISLSWLNRLLKRLVVTPAKFTFPRRQKSDGM